MKKNILKLPTFLAAVLVLAACVPEPQKPVDMPSTEPVETVQIEDVLTNSMDISAEDLADIMEIPQELLEATPTEEEAQALIDQYNALDPEDRDDPDIIGAMLKDAAVVTKLDLEKREELADAFESRGLDIEDSYQRMKALCAFTDLQADDFERAVSYFFNRGEVDLDSILNLTSNTSEWTEDQEIQVLQIITRSNAGSKADLQAACRNLFSDLKNTNFGEDVNEEVLEEEQAFEMPTSEMEKMALTEQLAVDPSTFIIEGRDVNGNPVDGIIDESDIEENPATPTSFDPSVFPDQEVPTAEELGLDPEIDAIITPGTAAAEESLEIGGDGGLFSEEEMMSRHEAINQFMANTPEMVNMTFGQVINDLCEVELEPEPAGIFISRVFVERDNSFEEVMNIYQNDTLSASAKQSQILGMVLDAEDSTVEENVAACQEIIAGLPAAE